MTFSKLLKALSEYGRTVMGKYTNANAVGEIIAAQAKMTQEYAQSVLGKQPLSEAHSMTSTEAKQILREWCLSQVGYHESLDGSNKYGDGDWDVKLYGFDAKNVPWCDVFVDYSFIHCFGYAAATKMTYQTPVGYAACKLSADAYKKNGAYFSQPEVGDQVFFFYGGDINHTGIVVDVDGDTITCVEGNYSDGVGLTKYNTRNQWLIAGYGRPDWSVVSDTECSDDACPIPSISPVCNKEMWIKLAERMPEVRYGSLGDAVKALQAMLNFLGAELDIDGDCGILTEKEIKEFQEGRL